MLIYNKNFMRIDHPVIVIEDLFTYFSRLFANPLFLKLMFILYYMVLNSHRNSQYIVLLAIYHLLGIGTSISNFHFCLIK